MKATPPRPPEVASQEARLLDYAERLSRFRQGRRAAHLRLSALQPYNRRDHHLRIAVKTFESMVSLFEGQSFLLGNGDIVFIGNQATPAAIEEAVMRVRHLFEGDPLVTGAAAAARFCTQYELGAEYDLFLQDVRTLHEEETRRQHRLSLVPEEGAARRPVDAHRVGELVEAIARADLSNLMRRQSVCMIMPNTPATPIFRELFISIPDLRDTVMPQHDITADRGLFQYLTRTLDHRMLSLLRKNDDSAINSSFSINLNVASVLSQEFLAFDADLHTTARNTIVIELQYTDIFGDIEAFFFARDFIKGRNYRLCLDGVTEMMMPFIDREKLGLDFVKLVWGRRMHDAMAAAKLDDFRAAVDRFGRARTILCRCDDDDAVRFGQAIGIPMFQGRGIEKLLAPAPTPARPPAATARAPAFAAAR